MKNWIKGLMACGLAFALTTSVYAEGPSMNGVGTQVGSTVTINGKETTAKVTFTATNFTSSNLGSDSTKASDAADAIDNLNTGKKAEDVVAEAMATNTFVGATKSADGKITVKAANADTTIDMSEVKMLTQFADIKLEGATGNETNIQFTWVDESLTEGMGAVVVMHYSTKRQVFEVLLPDSVNYRTKEITCTFPDLSPVALAYVPAAKVNSAIQGKPVVNTYTDATVEAVRNNTMFYFAGAAVVVAIAGAVVLKKRNQE